MSLDPILDALVQIAVTALLAVGIAAVRRLCDWLRLSADDQVRQYLQQAMEHAITHGIALAAQRDGGAPTAVIMHAARYVETRVPDALKRLGIGTDGLEHMLSARLARRMEQGEAGSAAP